jgi:histidine ammonia-lyase
MVLRINTLAKGRSGISKINLQRMVEAFNKGFIPCIPEQGTVGASGDLAPLSHLALGLMGEGLACSYSNPSFRDAGKVLEELGVEKIDLLEKEGLALINGTQFMSSLISEVIFRMESLLESAIAICAFSVEIFGVDSNLFLDSTLQVYDLVNPTVGKMLRRVAAHLDAAHSPLHHHRQLTNHQNKHACSILYCVESLASAAEALTFCKRIVEEEINGATDNPLVFHKEGKVYPIQTASKKMNLSRPATSTESMSPRLQTSSAWLSSTSASSARPDASATSTTGFQNCLPSW